MLKDDLKYYWMVEVERDVSKNGVVYLFGDSVEIGDAGELTFMKHDEDFIKDHAVACFAPGKWKAFYAASQIDGNRCCVEHIMDVEDD